MTQLRPGHTYSDSCTARRLELPVIRMAEECLFMKGTSRYATMAVDEIDTVVPKQEVQMYSVITAWLLIIGQANLWCRTSKLEPRSTNKERRDFSQGIRSILVVMQPVIRFLLAAYN